MAAEFSLTASGGRGVWKSWKGVMVTQLVYMVSGALTGALACKHA